jgi:hypothetical protein
VLAEHPRQLSPSCGSRPTTRKAPIKRDGRTAARSYLFANVAPRPRLLGIATIPIVERGLTRT